MSYAGYNTENGVVGDAGNVEFTEVRKISNEFGFFLSLPYLIF